SWVTDAAKTRFETAYANAHWLKKAIRSYLRGYRLNQNNAKPGTNALLWSIVLDLLDQQVATHPDPEVAAIRQQIPALKGAVQFSLDDETTPVTDYGLLIAHCEFALMMSEDRQAVTNAYQKVLTASQKNMFLLTSALSRLTCLSLLSFRPDHVAAGTAALQTGLQQIQQNTTSDDTMTFETITRVFLVSGHAVDHPEADTARFSSALESEAQKRIDKTLDVLKAGPDDLVVVPGANAGSEILLIEACLKRQMSVEIFLPFRESEYVNAAVGYAGDAWVARFHAIHDHSNVTINIPDDHIGPLSEGDNVYHRNARWTLYSALVYGIHQVHLIALWDGTSGPEHSDQWGPNDHLGYLVEQVNQLGGGVEHLDSTKFDYWVAGGKVGRMLDVLAQT
ncbi:MAG: hypothetical protein AAF485_23970, partial [Chloroflexota bacterium]